MSRFVVVGGSEKIRDCVIAIAAAAVVPVFLFWKRHKFPADLLVGISAISVVVIASALFVLFRRRLALAWATDLGMSLEVIDRRGKQTIADHSIGAISLLYDRSHSFAGEPTAQLRRLRLQVAGDTGLEEHKLESIYPLGSTDPLLDYVQRTVCRLTDTAQKVVERGGEFPGDGWQLTSRELRLRRGTDAATVQIRELSAVDFFDNHLCLWLGADELPCHKLPQDGWNIAILLGLLRRLMPQPSEGSADSRRQFAGLGRILYELSPSRTSIAMFGLLTVAAFAGLAATIVGWIRSPGGATQDFAIGCAVLGVVAALGAYTTFSARRELFRCYEGGVYQRDLHGERSLPFTEVEAFTFVAIRMYHNGIYSGTTHNLTFEPIDGKAEKRIHYNKTSQKGDEMLDTIRDHVAHVVGSRMARSMLAGEAAIWTPTVRFEAGNLVYRSKKKSREEIRRPIAQVHQITFEEGTLFLFAEGEETSFLAIETKERNFFPGFACLQTLVSLERERSGRSG